MAAKPKLSPDEWKHTRDVWELDTRKGFVWLIEELSLPVSVEAVRLKSKNEAWKKRHKPSLENQKTKLGKRGKNQASEQAKRKRSTVRDSENIDNDKKINESDGDVNSHGNSRYCEEYNDQVYKLCLLGAIDKDLADFFEVNVDTIYKWKKTHPEFAESIKKGKMMADAEVAHSLYKRANGYSHPAAHISNFAGEITVTEYVKHYPPDTAAAFIFLKNRQPGWWKDRVEASVDVKLDKETLQQIEETFLARMEKSRARQDKILIERGILIEQDAVD